MLGFLTFSTQWSSNICISLISLNILKYRRLELPIKKCAEMFTIYFHIFNRILMHVFCSL